MVRETVRFSLGCVADDFTGASDVASFLERGGMRCLLLSGVPENGLRAEDVYDAAVIALKTRNAPAAQAVRESTQAFAWLREHGAERLYFKYCSTFDSTPRGNIGPVLDAMLETLCLPYTILCPALPENGRTVRGGRLFVHGVPLEESPMRHHPLNPMRDSDVTRLMEAQSRYPCFALTADMLAEPDAAIRERVAGWQRECERFYIVTDYFEEAHGRRIAALFGALPLLSGGSALAGYLGQARKIAHAGGARPAKPRANRAADGGALLLAGSCSEMTRRQIARWIEEGGAALRIVPAVLEAGHQTVEELWRFAREHGDEPVLLYSSQPPEEIRCARLQDQQRVSRLLEDTMAELARRAVTGGVRRMVVAGGETSGAVMRALGWNACEIGPCVAPGVPVMTPLQAKNIRLALKSGNFGQEDFFRRALEAMKEHIECGEILP